MHKAHFDVIVVGGGPAGLSAALILGRCRRSVLVLDSGRGRNRWAHRIHGYLTRDGTPPEAFLSLARSEVREYGVAVSSAEVTDAQRHPEGGFSVSFRTFCENGTPAAVQTVRCCKLLLATGMSDVFPEIDGFERFYGVSVHHCPYCDAWDHRDKRIVSLGEGDGAVGLALVLRNWSTDVTACTSGGHVRGELLDKATSSGVRMNTGTVVRLDGDGNRLRRIVMADGGVLACDAMFFHTAQVQRSDLPRRLGCTMREDGSVATTDRQCTGVPGLYVAGDADKDVQFVIVGSGEGATAAVAINREFQDEGRFACGC